MSTYGLLSNVQRGVLAPFVRDRVVHDLGAGDLTLSHSLAELGAKCVVAVDKEEMPSPADPRIVRVRRAFRDHRDQIDVAFLSWPWAPGSATADLVEIVARTKTVAYLGKNSDGSACGAPFLFELFSRRRLVAYVPEVPNTLCVYQGRCRARKALRGEERAGLLSRTRTFTFEEAEGGGEGRTFERDAPF